jgi:MFS transporter, DHA1 family, tetracycline resistance protein
MRQDHKRSPLLTIFLVVFLDLLGFGLVIPILPYYAQQFGASAWDLGLLMMCYSLMQFIFAPLWGRISDQYGRRPVLLVSIAGSALSMLALGFANSLSILFIARLFNGICGANISTAYAYVTDVTTDANRAKGMGMIGASFGLGFVFGPAFGGLLSVYGYAAPMFVAAALSSINFVMAYRTVVEPYQAPEVRMRSRSHRKVSLETWKQTFAQKNLALPIGLFFILTFAVTQMEIVFALYMQKHFAYDAKSAGILLAVMGITMALVQGLSMGKLSKMFAESKLVMFGFITCAVSLALFAIAWDAEKAGIALTIMAIGHGVLHPTLSSLTSKASKAHERGAVMGVFHSVSSLARVIGPIVAGFLYDFAFSSAPFWLGVLLLSGAVGLVVKNPSSYAPVDSP